jgi:hypothetical protein
MKKFKQSEAGERGWYIGAFDGAVFKTDLFEVSHVMDRAGTHSPKHVHKIATEINLITSGRLLVNGEEFSAGEGFIFEPGESCEVDYLEDTWTLVVKTPSVPSDKYYI